MLNNSPSGQGMRRGGLKADGTISYHGRWPNSPWREARGQRPAWHLSMLKYMSSGEGLATVLGPFHGTP